LKQAVFIIKWTLIRFDAHQNSEKFTLFPGNILCKFVMIMLSDLDTVAKNAKFTVLWVVSNRFMRLSKKGRTEKGCKKKSERPETINSRPSLRERKLKRKKRRESWKRKRRPSKKNENDCKKNERLPNKLLKKLQPLQLVQLLNKLAMIKKRKRKRRRIKRTKRTRTRTLKEQLQPTEELKPLTRNLAKNLRKRKRRRIKNPTRKRLKKKLKKRLKKRLKKNKIITMMLHGPPEK